MNLTYLIPKVQLCFLLTVCLLVTVNTFQLGDPVKITANKLSSYGNPTDSYKYYDLPFCRPVPTYELPLSLGEKLTGNRKMNSAYNPKFGNNIPKAKLCDGKLEDRSIQRFRDAINQHYIFEMWIEDISVGNVIGYTKNNRTYLATHLNFNIYYNKQNGNIIKASVDFDETQHVIDITYKQPHYILNFTYSVVWAETAQTTPTINNGNNTFFSSDTHWLSFLNGIALNIFLLVIVRSIFQKIQRSESSAISLDFETESKDFDFNWKVLRGEVFKIPALRNLLCASVGTGIQLILTVILLLFFGGFGIFDHNKGSIFTRGIVIYIITSVVAGLSSGKLFRYLGGKQWQTNLSLTVFCFTAPLFVTTIILNSIAWIKNSTAALSVGTLMILVCFWLLGVVPLTALGALASTASTEAPLSDVGEKPAKANKSIANQPFYQAPLFTVLIAGLFPFSVLHFELFYVFGAIWQHKVFTSFEQLLVVFVMTLCITACVSIIFTYFQLNNKDYRWWWRSFLYGGSCGLYVFLYAIYFYSKKSQMSTFLQACYYFGYSGLLSFAVCLIFGAMGFLSTSAFLKQLYERHKKD